MNSCVCDGCIKKECPKRYMGYDACNDYQGISLKKDMDIFTGEQKLRELQLKNKNLIKALENIREACRPGTTVNQNWVYLKVSEFLEKYQ